MLKDRRLVAVQRRFTKKLEGLRSLTYTERLTLLGLERLETRRIRADISFVNKLLFGFTVLRADHHFCLSQLEVTHSNCFCLAATPTFVNIESYFCNRIVKVWNDLHI